jgi:hypothetical protein
MKDKTTTPVYRSDLKIIKDLTNKLDFKTQADFTHALLKIYKQFKPELNGVKK